MVDISRVTEVTDIRIKRTRKIIYRKKRTVYSFVQSSRFCCIEILNEKTYINREKSPWEKLYGMKLRSRNGSYFKGFEY